MHYALLNIWSQTHTGLDARIESIRQGERYIDIVFKDRRILRFVLDARDAFVYLHQERNLPQVEIWSQLRNAQITKLWLDSSDRILSLELQHKDIYQETHLYRLIAELSPPRPNLILCEMQDDSPIVIDALHKYSLADNPARQILPSLEYQPPQTGWTPDKTTIPPPWELKRGDGAPPQSFTDINAFLQAHYEEVFIAEGIRRQRQQQLSQLQKAIAKQSRKLDKQKAELESAAHADTYRLYAEVIKYNLHQLQKGQSSLEAVNYYDPAMPQISIPLQSQLSPTENMDWYLKRYKKAKSGFKQIQQNIAATQEELSRLQEIHKDLEAGREVDYIPTSHKASASQSFRPNIMDKLLRIRIEDGFEIVIGRKASENDFISTQLGKPHDWWFHARIYRGAHVLLRCLHKTEPSPELKTICCRLAAWFSKARFSSNVPVDYTQVRFLRKPRRSAPGFITYTQHQGAFVEPISPRQLREEMGL